MNNDENIISTYLLKRSSTQFSVGIHIFTGAHITEMAAENFEEKDRIEEKQCGDTNNHTYQIPTMTTGACTRTHCGREATDLKKCTGACGGDAPYCNRKCQRLDWSMHRKICPRVQGASAQPLMFVLPPPPNIMVARMESITLGNISVRAVRRMDGYGNSGLSILFSDHLGIDPLIPYAKINFANDNEDEARANAELMIKDGHAYDNAVTSPAHPGIMKLKPGEACFNTEKHQHIVSVLLSEGIITDTGMRVHLGLYQNDFSITDSQEEVMATMRQQEEILAKLSVTPTIESTEPTVQSSSNAEAISSTTSIKRSPVKLPNQSRVGNSTSIRKVLPLL